MASSDEHPPVLGGARVGSGRGGPLVVASGRGGAKVVGASHVEPSVHVQDFTGLEFSGHLILILPAPVW